MLTAECAHGDHLWQGGGSCVLCGEKLRCLCGQFVTEAGLDDHLRRCPVVVGVTAAPEALPGRVCVSPNPKGNPDEPV